MTGSPCCLLESSTLQLPTATVIILMTVWCLGTPINPAFLREKTDAQKKEVLALTCVCQASLPWYLEAVSSSRQPHAYWQVPCPG